MANLSHLHWYKLVRMKNKQKKATRICLVGKEIPPAPLLVTITRLAPRKLDDDNLQGACKFIRDEIARKVGIDDGSSQYTWRYEQKTAKTYGVDVEITSR